MINKFPSLRTLRNKSGGMSLSRRLTLSLLAILLLFALNVATHFWGSFVRTDSMFAYRNSVSAQQLATVIGQQLEEQRKQILVLAALRETTDEPLGEEDRNQAREGLRMLSASISSMGAVIHEDTRLLFDALWKESQFLLPAWQQFYSNYNEKEWQPPDGRPDAPDHYEATREQLQALEVQQRSIAEEQAAVIDRTIALTDGINAASFFASILLSSILGFFLVRYTRRSLSRLKTGALRFGSGDLDHRIDNIRDTGELGDLALTFNDMSDKLRDAIEQARRAKEDADQANRAKSLFLTNVSHELRTPLNVIIGYSEMLFDEVDDTTEVSKKQFQEDLDKITLSGKQLLSLINDILDLSKIETGRMTLYAERFDARQSLEQIAETIRPLLRGNNNTLELDASDPLPEFVTDPTKFRQVFVNLLSNACKFTRDGLIRLSAKPLPDDPSRVAFRVSDNGLGMTEEQQNRIFDAFVQADTTISRDYGGTGLGLAICKEYCELMGGEISVESELGVGTSFRVNLPARIDDRASDHAVA